MNKIAIIALKYLEPDYVQTMECLQASNLPVYYADRDGVGNMSRAFNEAFTKHVVNRYEYVWFVTNIRFAPEVPAKLAQALDNGYAAVHPNFLSDHMHMRNNGTADIVPVPFIEFTAPMFRTEDFAQYLLCEDTWYYYMDLIISDQLRNAGRQIAVHHGCSVQHTYLRLNHSPSAISMVRRQLRTIITPLNKAYMVDRFGQNWEHNLWKRHIK